MNSLENKCSRACNMFFTTATLELVFVQYKIFKNVTLYYSLLMVRQLLIIP